MTLINKKTATHDWHSPKTLLQSYKIKGLDLIYDMDKERSAIKLKDMTDANIIYAINDLVQNNGTLVYKVWVEEWIDIFNDVIMKRRFEKLKKLMNNINGKDNI